MPVPYGRGTFVILCVFIHDKLKDEKQIYLNTVLEY